MFKFPLPRLQVVPGSRVDDVTATRQMMILDLSPSVHPGSLLSSASKHELEWKDGECGRLSDGPHSSLLLPCDAVTRAALCQEVILSYYLL